MNKKTGQRCETSGHYAFAGYVDGSTSPKPSQEERMITLSEGGTFPPINSSDKAAYWQLKRAT
ncbi:hypothetical protein PPSIR1_36102 [Plesiocystis pacifica SIR-1]|uniref:YjzC family protein n=1 Tax=Plesiocystis pacifica SIR-1 TaxID=391625 RepID=A6G1Z9_9BACT|nr:YjzC family protein [Plesiocystis pacifica]EDM80189.1 hypothetical protein PPSIR1_36102 [Plesiocystis pacifica SIR-1]